MKREKIEGGYVEHHPFLGPNFYDENGKKVLMICHNLMAPDPKPAKRAESPHYEVRPSGNCGQEILDTSGTVVCWTTDEVMAALICKLLNVYKKVKG